MGRLNIRHHIATIRTDSKQDCWAASTAMVMRRHSTAGTDHVKSLAQAAKIPLDVGTLPDSSVPLLARAVKLRLNDFQSKVITLELLAEVLVRGPVVAFGFFNFPRQPESKSWRARSADGFSTKPRTRRTAPPRTSPGSIQPYSVSA